MCWFLADVPPAAGKGGVQSTGIPPDCRWHGLRGNKKRPVPMATSVFLSLAGAHPADCNDGSDY